VLKAEGRPQALAPTQSIQLSKHHPTPPGRSETADGSQRFGVNFLDKGYRVSINVSATMTIPPEIFIYVPSCMHMILNIILLGATGFNLPPELLDEAAGEEGKPDHWD
jgi:hypothetical protein